MLKVIVALTLTGAALAGCQSTAGSAGWHMTATADQKAQHYRDTCITVYGASPGTKRMDSCMRIVAASSKQAAIDEVSAGLDSFAYHMNQQRMLSQNDRYIAAVRAPKTVYVYHH